jgi:hypothetical protein
MKLSELKNYLSTAQSLHFELYTGAFVPEHFHVTEVGIITKQFIDCGGTVRNEKVANFQLWDANDFDHRLKPQKLLNIIHLSEKTLGMEDLEIEVEYQTETIGKYQLMIKRNALVLIPTQTNCLAKDKCGIPVEKLKVNIDAVAASCTPGSGCC